MTEESVQIIQKQRIAFAPLQEISSGKISSCVLNGGKEVVVFLLSFYLQEQTCKKKGDLGCKKH